MKMQAIILTNGFVKKTQETPPDEIALAKKYRADYLQRIRQKLDAEEKILLRHSASDEEKIVVTFA